MTSENRSYQGKLISEKSSFAINEAFKMLRANLFYTAKGEKCPVYGITSTFAHSGKSLLISNLAVSFAQLEKKVLLIDCDLRSSVVHKIFDLEKSDGISELLASADSSVDKYIKKTKYQNLSIITAGGTPPNPAELLASARMGKFIEFLKQHFDIIFIDLPPVGIVSDAVIINEQVTGYLYVVRSRADDSRSLTAALSTMEQMDAKIIGLVLNDVDPKTGGYGRYGRYGKYGKNGKYGKYGKKYGYGNRYGYGYGYGYGHHRDTDNGDTPEE
ncbi:MAG: CpsD/CapB family tyrosine-protein kinase [Clostridia bacterium]|nr:CpsD/CapB family tyrosine-protein kinase [Clostridia bacterium]